MLLPWSALQIPFMKKMKHTFTHICTVHIMYLHSFFQPQHHTQNKNPPFCFNFSFYFQPPHFCLGLRFAISQDLPPDLFAALLELFVVSWAPKSARLAPQVLQATTPCAAVLHTAAQLLEVAVNPRLTCWVTWNQWGSLFIVYR